MPRNTNYSPRYTIPNGRRLICRGMTSKQEKEVRNRISKLRKLVLWEGPSVAEANASSNSSYITIIPIGGSLGDITIEWSSKIVSYEEIMSDDYIRLRLKPTNTIFMFYYKDISGGG